MLLYTFSFNCIYIANLMVVIKDKLKEIINGNCSTHHTIQAAFDGTVYANYATTHPLHITIALAHYELARTHSGIKSIKRIYVG